MRIKWQCPKCGAEPGEHGKGGADKCISIDAVSFCDGFLCDCDVDSEGHGKSYSDQCTNAVCSHCGWSGTFPVKPRGMLPWEKKALEAGWSPPEDWRKGIKGS